MTWQNWQLGSTILKATEDRRLWQTEKGIVEVNKETLAIPIKLDEKEKGYIFHGHGKLLLDTIVETEEGAIGKPVEKELSKPFLMLADTEETQQHLTEAKKEDLEKMGYEDQQGFVDEAKDFLNRFLKNACEERQCHHPSSEHRGFIFAFQNQNKELDILVANGAKLVYTSKDLTFVSNKNNTVLRGPDEVLCSSDGRVIIINKGKSVIIKKCACINEQY